jgi:hypothetical protein
MLPNRQAAAKLESAAPLQSLNSAYDRAIRPPHDSIFAPEFPPGLPWINGSPTTIGGLAGAPFLIEFWDFCRPNSIRTLPYVKAWHARYAEHGLHVIGVHSPGFEPSSDPDNVRAAVARLGIEYPVIVDLDHAIWRIYENLGWPARYLFTGAATLSDYHYGEGAYADTESAIQTLLGVELPLLAPLRPEDAPGALLALQTDDTAGPYSGPYEAGGAWAVLDGHGTVSAFGREHAVEHPGAYELISHPRSTRGVVELETSPGVRCLAVCFTPGLAGPGVQGSA